MSWKTFLRAHWDVIAASDMFTVELWLGRSLVRYHVLFAIELATRRVNIMGIVQEPYGKWMEQVARNATDGFGSFLTGKRYMITDRERNHQGLANGLIEPEVERDNGTGKVVCEPRLGGHLNHYRRAA